MTGMYDVLVGCNYPPNNTRAEAGDVIELDDTTAKALSRIKAVKAQPAPAPAPAADSTPVATDQAAAPDASTQAQTAGTVA